MGKILAFLVACAVALGTTMAVPASAAESDAKAPQKAQVMKKSVKKPAKKKTTPKKDPSLGKMLAPAKQTTNRRLLSVTEEWLYDGPNANADGTATCFLHVVRPKPALTREFVEKLRPLMDGKSFNQLVRLGVKQEAESMTPLSTAEREAILELLESGCKGTANFA